MAEHTSKVRRPSDPTEPEEAGPRGSRFDVVALVSSAGGLEATRILLRELPADLPACVIVAQHLAGQGSTLVNILRRHATLPLEWASTGARLMPGRVLVCPPRRRVEVLPDGTCTVDDTEVDAREKPLDRLLESMAETYGSRALAVVLTGMGKDGAAGAVAIKRAGGFVLVQSEESAEQPSMPRAVIDRGAADLVLRIHELAPVIADVVRGGDLPRPRAEVEAAHALLAGPGEVRRQLRAIDWTLTPLGPVAKWPTSLRTVLRLVLDSPMPMLLLWGADFIQLYNDQYRLAMNAEHPAGLGQAGRGGALGLSHLQDPIFERLRSGESVALQDTLCPVRRDETWQDAWFDFSFAPVHSDSGDVAGVLATIVQTTTRVLARRRLRTLQALTIATTDAATVHVALQRALATLGGDATDARQDVPFALGYLLEIRKERAQLVAATGIEPGTPMAPHTLDVRAGHPVWPLATVLAIDADRSRVLIDDLATRFRGSSGPDDQAPTAAMLLPIRPTADKPPTGVLICGLNPRLLLDDVYLAFLDLIAARVSATLAEAYVRQTDRERLDRLAELDRAKTEFLSNVSHEFRTPLTLLLGPLDELSGRRDELSGPVVEALEVAARNARQLLNQVNTLLDFSQAEERRLRPRFEPIDLAGLTRDIASLFHSAADRAGLRLRMEGPPLAEPVWVDRQMWEKIVGNLLSNALKFTLHGEIVIELHARAKHAELVVRDTGVGIPLVDQPRIFKRFHRARGPRGRTNKGSGIGLALVYELVRLHQGRVRVQSEEGQGATFTVWVPLGRRPQREEDAERASTWMPEVAAALADEAATWMSESASDTPPDVAVDVLGPPPAPAAMLRGPRAQGRARILVVDDNADMRDYLRRLLAEHWDVTVAADGADALTAIGRARPDLVIADVMMPGLDGFELLTRIRRDGSLNHMPVVLVTARAGEGAAIEGLHVGAEDYIAKPFSPRELVARVRAVIERNRVEAELRMRDAWVRGQREALEAAIKGAPLATSLGALVRTTVETLGEGTRAAFYLTNGEGTTLHHVVGMSDGYAQAADGFVIGPASLACDLAASTGEPVVTIDVMQEPRWEPWRWMAAQFDYRGCWSFPIHAATGACVGSFAVYSRQPRDATPRDRELASLLTQTAAIIFARHTEAQARTQAEAALREHEAALRRSREAAVRELDQVKHLQQVSSLMIEPVADALHEQILHAGMAITHADFGRIERLNEADHLELLASWHVDPDAAEQWNSVSQEIASVGRATLVRRARVIVPDVECVPADIQFGADTWRQFQQHGIRAVQSTPLVSSEGRVVGVMSTCWRAPHSPDERELALIDILARQAADFIERRRTQEALRVGTLTFEAATGTIVEANESFLAITGYTREQIARRELTWRALTAPEYVAATERQMQRLAETGRIGPYEREYMRADGTRTWLLFVGANIGDGKVVEYCIDLPEGPDIDKAPSR